MQQLFFIPCQGRQLFFSPFTPRRVQNPKTFAWLQGDLSRNAWRQMHSEWILCVVCFFTFNASPICHSVKNHLVIETFEWFICRSWSNRCQSCESCRVPSVVFQLYSWVPEYATANTGDLLIVSPQVWEPATPARVSKACGSFGARTGLQV